MSAVYGVSFPAAGVALGRKMAAAVRPRRAITVSAWAEAHMELSSKTSPYPGKIRLDRTPLLREIMDTQSTRSRVRETVCRFPIQFGKSTIEQAVVGYGMTEDPGPMMVCLPGEVSLDKFINQKLNPLLECEAVLKVLGSVKSRDAANTKTFKDFHGGQLYMEHAGNPKRLKSTTVKRLIVDEWSSFASSLSSGDDPGDMMDGRVSAYPHSSKTVKVGSPEIEGSCRISADFQESDQRHPHVPCPHCGHMQYLSWGGLHWDLDPITGKVVSAWYVCGGEEGCGAIIEEHHKRDMLARHRWVPHRPGVERRGYHANCLYYSPGLGPTWKALAQMWLDAQGNNEKLKTFINDRLAEPWVDASLKAMQRSALQDRAEAYPLRKAPMLVCYITVGVDTQDNRLEVHVIGWGWARGGLRAWTLDYRVLEGNPANQQVWDDLTQMLSEPVEHESGARIPVSAVAIDGRGHRTKFVKEYAARRELPRVMVIFGAKAANAPVLGRPKFEELGGDGKVDRAGIQTWAVGTVEIKHHFFRRLGSDADLPAEERHYHFPDCFPKAWYDGITSEIFDPRLGRYVKKRGAPRNEPLDTWGYGYAAAHHPELRLHRLTAEEWRLALERIQRSAPVIEGTPEQSSAAPDSAADPFRPAPASVAHPSISHAQPARRRAGSSYLGRK